MAISAADDLEIIEFDIKIAYLNGDIVELLYMDQPEGFVDNAHLDYVCLLCKALYGLKQESHNWNHKFHQFLLQLGLKSVMQIHVPTTLHKAGKPSFFSSM